MSKWGGWSQTISTIKRKHVYIYEKLTSRDEIWKISDNSKRSNFLLNCRRVIWIIISDIHKYRRRCTSPGDEEIQALKAGETKTSSSPSESPHSKQACSWFLCCSLLFRNNVLKQTDDIVNEFYYLSKLVTVAILSLDSGSGSGSSSGSDLGSGSGSGSASG